MKVKKEIEQLSEQGKVWELREMFGNGYNEEIKKIARIYLNLAGAIYVFNMGIKAIGKGKEENGNVNTCYLRTLQSIAKDGLLLGDYASKIAELVLQRISKKNLRGNLRKEIEEMEKKWKTVIKKELENKINNNNQIIVKR